LLVRRTPAHARDAAARQRAEAREREQPVLQSRQRHGEHDPGVYRLDFMTESFLERAAVQSAPADPPNPQEGTVDFTLTPDQEALRKRVRAWLTANIPDDWKKFGLSEVPRP